MKDRINLTKTEMNTLIEFAKQHSINNADLNELLENNYVSVCLTQGLRYSPMNISLVVVDERNEINFLTEGERKFCDNLFNKLNVLVVEHQGKENKLVLKHDLRDLREVIDETESALLYILDEEYDKSFDKFLYMTKEFFKKKKMNNTL